MRKHAQNCYQEELAYFRSYHKNEINWRIHCICIPLEWLSVLLLCCYICEPLLFVCLIAIYYLILGTPSSSYAAGSLLLLCHFTPIIFRFLSADYAWLASICLQILAWFVQVIIGHNYFENNSPGMLQKISLNSVTLSFLMIFEARCSIWRSYRFSYADICVKPRWNHVTSVVQHACVIE
jgi:uncharacterized membrane protein YGL010W